ncbi:universal stress protein [Acidovorax sp.]|uniref:universal stress protein n=1 Tax=Acidovorax sp. TaxID=1872122 RepID=UPI00391AF2E3
MGRFVNVLYFVHSQEDMDGIDAIFKLAQDSQAKLTLVDVVAPVGGGRLAAFLGKDVLQLQELIVGARVRELKMVADEKGHGEVEVKVLVGKPYVQVVRQVLAYGYDLVIKRAWPSAGTDRLLKSDDLHLLRKCPCPVWLDKTMKGVTEPASKVLVPVDFDLDGGSGDDTDELNLSIMKTAVAIAAAGFSELHVVHVWDAPGEMMVRVWSEDAHSAGAQYVEGELSCHREAFFRFQELVAATLGQDVLNHIRPQYHLRRGSASDVIPRMAREIGADLVVMGTLARTGVAGVVIGNTAEDILDQLHCSVVAIKPPGFVSPITLDNM